MKINKGEQTDVCSPCFSPSLLMKGEGGCSLFV